VNIRRVWLFRQIKKLNKEDKEYILNKIIYGMVDKGDYYEPEAIISL
jgi:hypothetical protein